MEVAQRVGWVENTGQHAEGGHRRYGIKKYAQTGTLQLHPIKEYTNKFTLNMQTRLVEIYEWSYSSMSWK